MDMAILHDDDIATVSLALLRAENTRLREQLDAERRHVAELYEYYARTPLATRLAFHAEREGWPGYAAAVNGIGE